MAMPLTHHRFTVDDYHRMAEAGILTEDDRVELLDGQIVPMTPIGPRHARCVDDLNRVFTGEARGRFIVRIQNPIVIEGFDEPEPDLALVRPRPDRYRRAHPGPPDVLLVVEVADTTAHYDREVKVPLYARAGIHETWLVDLTAGQLEVYRDARDGAYTERRVLTRGDSISPLGFPDVKIAVDEILG